MVSAATDPLNTPERLEDGRGGAAAAPELFEQARPVALDVGSVPPAHDPVEANHVAPPAADLDVVLEGRDLERRALVIDAGVLGVDVEGNHALVARHRALEGTVAIAEKESEREHVGSDRRGH